MPTRASKAWEQHLRGSVIVVAQPEEIGGITTNLDDGDDSGSDSDVFYDAEEGDEDRDREHNQMEVEGAGDGGRMREPKRTRSYTRYHARKAKGLCIGCGRNQTNGKGVRCDNCLAHEDARRRRPDSKAKEYATKKRLREEALEKVVCGKCHKRPCLPSRTLCEVCTRDRSEYYQRGRYANKSKGICIVCRKMEAEGTKVRCKECSLKAREYVMTAKRRAWREAGKCCKCGKVPPAKGRESCDGCDKLDEASSCKEPGAKAAEKGMCLNCGKRPPRPGWPRCEVCYQHGAESRRRWKLAREASSVPRGQGGGGGDTQADIADVDDKDDDDEPMLDFSDGYTQDVHHTEPLPDLMQQFAECGLGGTKAGEDESMPDVRDCDGDTEDYHLDEPPSDETSNTEELSRGDPMSIDFIID
ncbi:hypothetical protein PGQ11_006224 [Apiospora arundinis]|uniref:Stc1 domain-containing protein n=1 Tax=Apiospora arundinis TaxID=335852 RepID=A0ABR2ISV2_9PEZI